MLRPLHQSTRTGTLETFLDHCFPHLPIRQCFPEDGISLLRRCFPDLELGPERPEQASSNER